MAIKTDSPQVSALRKMVEARFGHSIDSRTDFTLLTLDIENSTKEHLSENTLRRLWGRIPGYGTTFTRTVDVLSQYAGFENWMAFCRHLKLIDAKESDLITTTQTQNRTIKVEELEPGDLIRIGWMPDRECIVKYIGGRTFEAIEAHNATLQSGDSFECSIMIKGYPLFIDNLVHGGEHCLRYSIGTINGLTTLELL